MHELYPYFTNDGTLGLFSCEDDDIYHSTYGALSESWETFIIPSRLEQYISTHDEVKILDICYGIGYNTKTALNVFVKNYFKNTKKYSLKKILSKNQLSYTSCIAAIHTDNKQMSGRGQKCNNYCEFFKKISFRQPKASSCISAIDADNIRGVENGKKWSNDYNYCNKILIDAIDLDNILIDISPFIIEAKKFKIKFGKRIDDNNYILKTNLKYQQVKDIKKSAKKINKNFKLRKEISIILLKKLFKQNPEFFNDPILQQILSEKKYSPFFSKSMLNFAKFYQNWGTYLSKKRHKSTFLHNIYYQYISRSYKNVRNLFSKTQIDVNFHKQDARKFILTNSNKYNFIFLDAFTPAKAPALWTVQFFKGLYDALEDDGMILTYSNSAAVRNSFLENDFFVGKIYDKNLKKFAGTVAVKNKNLIEHKLDELDLDLINSKAGICFQDENMEFDNNTIIKNREKELENSNLTSSSKIVKGYKKNHAKQL